MKYEDLSSRIIGICIKVHTTFGPGLLESVYEHCICHELKKAGIPFRRQQPIPVIYDGEKMDVGFRADVVVDNKILLEIKSTDSITPVFKKITLTYLKLTGIEVGLLINFNVVKLTDGITRLVEDRK